MLCVKYVYNNFIKSMRTTLELINNDGDDKETKQADFYAQIIKIIVRIDCCVSVIEAIVDYLPPMTA